MAELTEAQLDRMRARLLVSVAAEDAEFILRVVDENERLQARLAVAGEVVSNAVGLCQALRDGSDRLTADFLDQTEKALDHFDEVTR